MSITLSPKNMLVLVLVVGCGLALSSVGYTAYTDYMNNLMSQQLISDETLNTIVTGGKRR